MTKAEPSTFSIIRLVLRNDDQMGKAGPSEGTRIFTGDAFVDDAGLGSTIDLPAAADVHLVRLSTPSVPQHSKT